MPHHRIEMSAVELANFCGSLLLLLRVTTARKEKKIIEQQSLFLLNEPTYTLFSMLAHAKKVQIRWFFFFSNIFIFNLAPLEIY